LVQLPHHWFNIARERQEAQGQAAYQQNALLEEIDRLKRLVNRKDAEIARLRKLTGAIGRSPSGTSKSKPKA